MSSKNMSVREIKETLETLKFESIQQNINIDFQIDPYLFRFPKRRTGSMDEHFILLHIHEVRDDGNGLTFRADISQASIKRFRRFMIEHQFGIKFRENLERISLLLL